MVRHVKSMGASTAGVLSFKSISKDILGHISPFINYTNLDYGFLWLFKGYSFWSMWWS